MLEAQAGLPITQKQAQRTPADVCERLTVHADVVTALRGKVLSASRGRQLAEQFRVLSAPSRLRLLAALELAELCVCDLAALLDMTPSAVSHQLRILRQAGLVDYSRRGKEVYYHLTDHPALEALRQLQNTS